MQELIEIAFTHAGLDWEEYIKIDPSLIRPAEVDHLVADPSKAKKNLNWTGTVSFGDLVKMMVDADIERVGRGVTAGTEA